MTLKTLKPLDSGIKLTPTDEALRQLEEYQPDTEPSPEPIPERTPSPIQSLDDFLVLHDIQCVDANGRVFEEYDELHVAGDVVRDAGGNIQFFTSYNNVAHFDTQDNDLFAPSFALTCNILMALYEQRSKNPAAEQLLQQYEDKGNGNGWHAQNTIVDWKNDRIIHYPHDTDFPEYGGTKGINTSRTKQTFDFTVRDFDDITLSEALKKPNFAQYLQNLTGLQDPGVLIDIGKHFEKTARVWVPDNPASSNHTSGAWLGCDSDDLDVNTCSNLHNINASRGVFFKTPQASR